MDPKYLEPRHYSLGGGSISENLVSCIMDILPENNTILELGSGYGTIELCKHYKVYSVEHEKDWIGFGPSTYIHAPLTPHKEVSGFMGKRWYDREILERELPKLTYDLLLVDGPAGTKRVGFLKYIHLFNTNIPIIFDDVNGNEVTKLCFAVAHVLNKPFTVYDISHRKQFAVINDPRLKI